MRENDLRNDNVLLEERELSRQTWISATFLLIVVSLISKVLGLLREILVAKHFGLGVEVDSYMVAITVPVLIGGIMGSGLGTSLIPLCLRTLSNSGSERARNLIKSTFSLTSIMSLSFIVVIYLGAQTVVHLIAPSLPDNTTKLAVELIKWLSLLVLGNSLFNVLSSAYHALHHFRIPAFTDLLSNLCVIIVLIFFSSLWGIYALVVGLIAGIYLVVVILFLHSLKLGTIGFKMDFKTKEFRDLIYFALPISLYMLFPQVSGIVENYFASPLKEGSISALGYARRLSDALTTLMALNIAKATFPTFSLLSSEKKIDELRDLVSKLSKQIIIYFLPLSFVLVFFSEEVIKLVFMRGAFSPSAVQMTSSPFVFYAAILPANMLMPIYFRLCYAFSDTITPIKASVAGILFSFPFYYYLTPLLGITGIALTSSVSIVVTLVITGMSVRKKLEGLDTSGLMKSLGKSFLCASLSLLPFVGLVTVTKYSFIFIVSGFFVIYFILGWFMMKEEISSVWKSFKRMRSGNVK